MAPRADAPICVSDYCYLSERSLAKIGDDGADSWILRNYGVKELTASSISDARLKRAKELGFLNNIEVRALNAECLELPNASFDLVLCTQAYHHLHRPALSIL